MAATTGAGDDGASLFEAAKTGSVQEIRRVLGSRAKLDVNARNEGRAGCTALHYAAWNGMIASAECLIDAGADVNRADDYGRTPLHYAARMGHTVMVERLAARGADLHAVQQLGSGALHYAALDGHAATCQRLVKLGADVTKPNEAGSTPLALAEVRDQAKAIAYLRHETDKRLKG